MRYRAHLEDVLTTGLGSSVFEFLTLAAMPFTLATSHSFETLSRERIASLLPIARKVFEVYTINPKEFSSTKIVDLKNVGENVFESALRDEGVRFLSSGLKTGALMSLEVLHLTYNRITKIGMNFLLSTGTLTSLKHLNLCANELFDDGLVAFSHHSGALSSLEILDISNNSIGPRGMVSFSLYLSEGSLPQLVDLRMCNNKFGNEGMIAFGRAVRSGYLCNLTKLSASNVNMQSSGMFALNMSLPHMPVLEGMTLCFNNLEEYGLRTFVEVVFNTGCLAKLNYLDVSHHGIRGANTAFMLLSEAISHDFLPSLRYIGLTDYDEGDEEPIFIVKPLTEACLNRDITIE